MNRPFSAMPLPLDPTADGAASERRTAPPCPVCRAALVGFFAAIGTSDYWRCQRCLATFLEPTQRLDRAAEHAHYLCHENDPDDPRYRQFLAKLATPLRARLAPCSRVLDFGCGPGPALARMLEEAGHEVRLFDPFFAADPAVLARTYDAVTCSEVAEHLHAPAEVFDRLVGLLRPGGLLALMTCLQTDDARFADWHYRRDPTHVVFYKAATLERIAADRGLACTLPVKDVAILQKPRRET